MAKRKIKAMMIKLVSTAGTGYFYVARKNPTSIQQKLAFKKYDPVVRKHVLFTEVRISRAKKI